LFGNIFSNGLAGGYAPAVMEPKSNPQVANSPAFYSPAELSKHWKVSGMTLRRWRKAGKLKALHIGRQIRFAVSEIERFEANGQA
jgi:excisionase family DNA binding protein